MRLSPDGKTLFVAVSGSPIGGPGVDETKLPPANHSADGIAVVDLASGRVDHVLQAGTDPETFVLSKDGSTIYVSNEDSGSVSAIPVAGGGVPRTVKVGEQPEGVAVSEDGTRLFVACEASDYVAMLDARTLAPRGTVPLQGRPRTLLRSRDGKTIFVAVEGAGKLAMLSAEDGKLLALIDLRRGNDNVRPMGIAEAPSGHLLVTTGRGGSILDVDPVSGVVRQFASVGARPWGIAFDRSGKLVATANGPSGDVTILDARSGSVRANIKTGGSPWGVLAR
jgi:YVTN family beta-propeller protein